MTPATMDVDTTWKSYTVTFRDVMVLKCGQRGHTLFTPKTVDLMTDFIDAKVNTEEQVPAVMTVEEAARYLKVSTQTVYNLIKAGQLPAARVGNQVRFLREALLSFLENGVAQSSVAYPGTPDPDDPKDTGRRTRKPRRETKL